MIHNTPKQFTGWSTPGKKENHKNVERGWSLKMSELKVQKKVEGMQSKKKTQGIHSAKKWIIDAFF